ncbi:Protein of unknown function [Saccharopolyspora shandongensis]|uniref:DUF3592 domain-containing protein n=1 Tax=Saccharopolyspora shandongensis TaxID=418495 RepID=A0A1H2YFJ4_9PSEU|nr:DUF3592 domain-containing protein [Saccharopolyspora shandongensis]SDX03608.1 Protein of unknown function [Saccharopolyspora shandongensis]
MDFDFGVLPVLVPVVLGAIFLVGGARQIRRNRWLVRHGGRAHGIVVAQDSRWSSSNDGSGGSYHHAPVIEFVAEDGRTHRAKSEISKTHTSFIPGRCVLVHYDRADPAKIFLPGHDGGPAVIFTLIGAVVLTIGLGALWAFWRGMTADDLMDNGVLFGAVFLCVGGSVLAIGVAGILATLRIKTGPRSRGVVIGETTSTGPQGMTRHHAMVRWTAPTGEVLEAPSGRGRLIRRIPVGTEITVRCHPRDPHRILLAGDWPELASFAFLLFGGLFSVVGGVITWAVLHA